MNLPLSRVSTAVASPAAASTAVVSPAVVSPAVVSRRTLLRRSAVAAALVGSGRLWTPGTFAEELTKTAELPLTAPVAEGPFYPDKLPLDTDNDLLLLNDAITPAVGEVTHLTGVVQTAAGSPMRGVTVEIWQCDSNGAYIHSGSSNAADRDSNFQGYGRFLTASDGRYYFRTIKPVAYPGRTPHIHVAISRGGRRLFTTQLLIKGEPRNEKDGLFRRIQDPSKRETILAAFEPLQNSTAGELAANFPIILGHTAEEA